MYTDDTTIDKLHSVTKNKNNNLFGKDDAIDTTMRFKYLRQLEALYESTPQATLQLVFMMRTGSFSNIIFIISIFQSIISMTNSMLNNDRSYMMSDKFKSHKKGLPKPSIKYIKHTFLRLIEITYRIALLSLFWTIIGGWPFTFLIIIETIFVIIFFIGNIKYVNDNSFDWNEMFLYLNQVKLHVLSCIACMSRISRLRSHSCSQKTVGHITQI